jgi:hypothetical protein
LLSGSFASSLQQQLKQDQLLQQQQEQHQQQYSSLAAPIMRAVHQQQQQQQQRPASAYVIPDSASPPSRPYLSVPDIGKSHDFLLSPAPHKAAAAAATSSLASPAHALPPHRTTFTSPSVPNPSTSPAPPSRAPTMFDNIFESIAR